MNLSDYDLLLQQLTRRALLKSAGYGIGSLALGAMMAEEARAEAPAGPMTPRKPHFAAKAKRVIYLFMAGAPSQIDLFDPKPKLNEFNGQLIPEEFIKGERFAFIKGRPKLLGSPHTFAKYGQSGAEVSSLLPWFQKMVDDVAIVRSMKTDQFNHAPAQIFMNTGFLLPGRPSLGSWLSYGLGTENQDLPGFVVLVSGFNQPDGGKSLWSSGFLPTHFQGVEFRSKGDPVLFVTDPDGVTREVRRDQLDALRDLNAMRRSATGDAEIDTRINSYELAYRMQSSVPDLMDVSKEPQEVHELYGTTPGKASFANNCLLARRMIERGCRFVQLYHRGWDNHGESEWNDLKNGLGRLCQETDKACYALITDLKRRGLLEDTLVVWGGEFGRTPMNEERDGSPYPGRDHHPHAFTMWMAGAGIKTGQTLGATDELGYRITEDPVHIHDLNATILHLMGLDHTRLTYPFQGRDFRLTDVHGEVVSKLLK
jgi:hypothetical protein